MAVETNAGRYELEQLIGSGGMAAVYRGFDRRLERRVAVKILHASLVGDREVVERFRREAQTVARLSHPNVVSVIDRGEVAGRPYLVFEYVEGETLDQLLRRGPRLSIRRALTLAIEVGRGLAFAHSRGVIHRDVKPQNVLVGKGGAKVTDFGVAHAFGIDEVTLTGGAVGTSSYIAPEQVEAGSPDARSDVYSLGVVLFELLTGAAPYSGASFAEIALQHLNAPVPSLRARCPGASPRLAAAVERALAKDRERRFPSMEAFVAELAACLAEEEGDTETFDALPASVLSGRRRRRRAIGATLALAAILAAGGAAYLLSRPGTPAPAPAATQATPPPARPAATAPVAVALDAVAPYDPPPGDGQEDNPGLRLATDGNPATYWSTEWYQSVAFGGLKHGVGIVLAAAKPVRLTQLRIVSDTPRFDAIIKAGTSAHGPFTPVSAQMTAGAVTRFALHVRTPLRYYLIWITALAPDTAPHYSAHINEVTASGS